jgi:site-specific DNA recombinase
MQAAAVDQHGVDKRCCSQRSLAVYGAQMAQARAVVYTRQSTLREESISLELQERACRDYAASRGYDVVEVISDPGVSGLQFSKRPGIRRAIETVEAGNADTLLVWRWSRLSRRRTHQAVIIDRIEHVGGRVESATEPVDATTAGGRFSREVLLAAAAFESDTKSEQWKDAQARRVALRMPGGGPAPIGYTHAGRGEPYRPHSVLGPAMREAYDRYLRGQGPQLITKWLNDSGLQTPRGKAFSVATVRRALDSGFAAGYFTVGGELVQGVHEPLIDQATWQAYQRERDRRRGTPPKARQPKWFLGGGLAVCGRCGGNLIVNSYDSPRSQAICGRYKMQRSCVGTWVNRGRLETVVAMWMGGRIEEWAGRAEELHGVDDERDQLAKQRDLVAAEADTIRRGLGTAAKLVALGQMDEADYETARRDAETQQRSVVDQLAEIEARLDALNPNKDAYERLAVIYDQPDRPMDDARTAEWNALLRKIIRRVALNSQTIVVEPWRGEPAIYDRAVWAPRSASRGGKQTRGADGRFTHG